MGTVIVKYEDTEGTSISENLVKSDGIGEVYTTEPKDIEGYTFKEVKGKEKGQYTITPQTVTYIYVKTTLEGGESTSSSGSSSASNKPSETGSKAHSLPETGEKDGVGVILGGVLIFLVGIVLTFLTKLKRQK